MLVPAAPPSGEMQRTRTPPPPGRAPQRTRARAPDRAIFDDEVDEEVGEGFESETDDEDFAEFGEHYEEARSPWRTTAGWILTIALAVVISLLIRSFVAHAFHVESGSMEPTLASGDRILVNKLAGTPSRGDLIVFSRSDGDLVKRVVALPGETLEFREGLLKVGENWILEPYLVAGTGTFVRSAIPNCLPTEGFADNEACTVPEDHVFVMGDNRTVSFDSRNFGPVPLESLIGNAALQFWPLGDLRRL